MQSEGRVVQLGSGKLTRSRVFWAKSKTVKRSLGKGDCVGDCRLNSGCTPPAAARTGSRMNPSSKKDARRLGKRFQVKKMRFMAGTPPKAVQRTQKHRPLPRRCQYAESIQQSAFSQNIMS